MAIKSMLMEPQQHYDIKLLLYKDLFVAWLSRQDLIFFEILKFMLLENSYLTYIRVITYLLVSPRSRSSKDILHVTSNSGNRRINCLCEENCNGLGCQ